MSHEKIFVGFGSPQGDDQLAWMIVERLRDRAEAHGWRIRLAVEPSDLWNWLEEAGRLLLVDACPGFGPPGTWQRWDRADLPRAQTSLSSAQMVAGPAYGLSLDFVLQAAESWGKLPKDVVLFGLETLPQELPADAPETSPSEIVKNAIEQMLPHLEEELAREGTAREPA